MKNWMILAGVFGLELTAMGQDVGWLIEQAPAVSMVLVKTLEKCPSFSAKMEVNVSGKLDPIPTEATGTVEFRAGNLRWDVGLGDIKSAQLTQNARAVVKQINGDRFLLLTRPDENASYLVLPGAQACLEQALPAVKLSATKSQLGVETIDGRLCSKESLRALQPDGSTCDLVVWKAEDLKNLPVQVQITGSSAVIRVRFWAIRVRSVSVDRFGVPLGLAKYASVEDLVQSVLIEKMKKRIGLQ